jgi:hypothetical protein
MDASLTLAAWSAWDALSGQATRLRRVLVPLATIAEEAGLGPADLDSALDELSALGWATSWTAEGDPVATLTPLGAARLGLKLRRVREGMAGLAWMPADGREGRERCSDGAAVNATSAGVHLDAFADDQTPSAHQVAEAREQVDALGETLRSKRKLSDAELDADRLPRPSIILMGCQPWGERPSGPCPACNGAPIRRASTYCARCDRWGLDFLLGRIWRAIDRAEAERAGEKKARRKGFAARHAPAASA